MTEKQKQDATVLLAIVLIAALVWWILRRKAPSAANPATAPGFVVPPAAYWGQGNGPFAQGGSTPVAQDVFSQYNIPIPSFGYSGNSSVYMPLFGFVGYSNVGTYSGG